MTLAVGCQIHAAVVSPPRTSATITAHSGLPETKLAVPSRGSTSHNFSPRSASDSPAPPENPSSPTNRASGISSPNRALQLVLGLFISHRHHFSWRFESDFCLSEGFESRFNGYLRDLLRYFADLVHQVVARRCHGGHDGKGVALNVRLDRTSAGWRLLSAQHLPGVRGQDQHDRPTWVMGRNPPAASLVVTRGSRKLSVVQRGRPRWNMMYSADVGGGK